MQSCMHAKPKQAKASSMGEAEVGSQQGVVRIRSHTRQGLSQKPRAKLFGRGSGVARYTVGFVCKVSRSLS